MIVGFSEVIFRDSCGKHDENTLYITFTDRLCVSLAIISNKIDKHATEQAPTAGNNV